MLAGSSTAGGGCGSIRLPCLARPVAPNLAASRVSRQGLAMVESAGFGGEGAIRQRALAPSRLEADTAQSFSIETIEKLKPELALGDELFFLIGADAFAEIKTWKRWRDVARAVEFIVVSRPGHRYDAPEETRVHRLDTLQLPVSSSEIRASLAAGEAQVDAPPAVLGYIRERNLYSSQSHLFTNPFSPSAVFKVWARICPKLELAASKGKGIRS